nr:hypothetical protein Iba_chr14aCG2270 [Ipomoea batatas]
MVVGNADGITAFQMDIKGLIGKTSVKRTKAFVILRLRPVIRNFP